MEDIIRDEKYTGKMVQLKKGWMQSGGSSREEADKPPQRGMGKGGEHSRTYHHLSAVHRGGILPETAESKMKEKLIEKVIVYPGKRPLKGRYNIRDKRGKMK